MCAYVCGGESFGRGAQTQPNTRNRFQRVLPRFPVHAPKFPQTIQFYLTFIGLHLTFPKHSRHFFSSDKLVVKL